MSRKLIVLLALGIALWTTPAALAQSVELPPATLEGMIADLYSWSVRIVGLAAFLMLLYAGVLRIMGRSGESNQVIQDALTGLVLLLSAVVILNSISEDFTKQSRPVFEASQQAR